jgi:hypothetical protein
MNLMQRGQNTLQTHFKATLVTGWHPRLLKTPQLALRVANQCVDFRRRFSGRYICLGRIRQGNQQ